MISVSAIKDLYTIIVELKIELKIILFFELKHLLLSK